MTDTIFVQLLNGIVFGAILALVSLGLCLILGLLRVIHIGHAATYVIGAYIGYSVFSRTGNFLLAAIAALVIGAIIALIIEVIFIRRVYKDPEASIILTLGLLLAVTEITKLIWGPNPKAAQIPQELSGVITINTVRFSEYRLIIAGLGILILVAVWFFLKRTGTGLITRAVIDNRVMVESFGIKTSTILTLVFVLASAIAALAGYLGSPLFGIFPDVGTQVLILGFIVVIIGGIGNIWGTTVASLLVGVILAFMSQYTNPSIAYITIYFLMVVAIFWRPSGLLTRS